MKTLIFLFSIIIAFTTACQQNNNTSQNNTPVNNEIVQDGIIVYNSHLTNRCPSCIAIEDATTKTLKTYFAEELKTGKIKQIIIDVDDKTNSSITEKYEIYGSGLLIVKVVNGKEQTIDFTAEGFKFARNKEEHFMEILKNQIDTLLEN